MSQRQKLLEKARRGAELNGEDFRTLARGWGIEIIPPRGGGSHFRLYSEQLHRIQIVKLPGDGVVKRVYVKMLVEIIEEIEAGRTDPEGENRDEREDGDR